MIAPFKKTVKPGLVPVCTRNGTEALAPVFVTIELREREGGKPPELSITAVEGPLSNGNALGSCGQSRDLDVKRYADGWDRASVTKLRDIWERWHLNHMNPLDAAMRRDGWAEQAARPFLGYKFSLTLEAIDASRAAEKRALACLKEGVIFEPTPEETEAACRPYEVVLWVEEGEPEPAPPSEHYRRAVDSYGHNKRNVKHPERKTLGWLKACDHPEGLLGKKHPESGNRYGGSWYPEAVPNKVLQWLLALPENVQGCPQRWLR